MRSSDALLYSRTRQYAYRIDVARRTTERALLVNPAWYVAFSGGKDSTCVLALAREQKPDTAAVTSIQEWRLPDTAEYLSRVENLHQVASGSDHGTGWSPNWEGKDDVPNGVMWIGEKGSVVKNYGRAETGVFLGLREDENASRRVHLRTMGTLFFSKKNAVWQCSPIARWTVQDVWAFIMAHGLDYNRAYDRMSEIGVPIEQQRIGPFAVDKVLGYGQLAILKRGWPGVFNKYAERHPEARNYV
jgi:3'-phosphoadenosine 5'-phosphosulfate sulfotransferase (PAPS reductase)/FAD synthetase